MTRDAGRKTAGKRRGTSQRWLARQQRDPFARLAHDEGKGSRAHFKLQQLDHRFRLLRPGMRVLELGAAPGGWTSHIESRLQGGGLIVCDPRPVRVGVDTIVIAGVLGAADVDGAIDAALGERKLDLVLSDMSPNITGIRAADQARSMQLADLAIAAAQRWLNPGGGLVVKIFQGEDVDPWLGKVRKMFANVRLAKPKASRPNSREVYAVGQQFLVTG
jgi:23S rRNA (uridine2552-2'-O)-methyltransferase